MKMTDPRTLVPAVYAAFVVAMFMRLLWTHNVLWRAADELMSAAVASCLWPLALTMAVAERAGFLWGFESDYWIVYSRNWFVLWGAVETPDGWREVARVGDLVVGVRDAE